jgi:hypothetical protein
MCYNTFNTLINKECKMNNESKAVLQETLKVLETITNVFLDTEGSFGSLEDNAIADTYAMIEKIKALLSIQ